VFPNRPEHATCPGCGVSQPVKLLREHVCDWWLWLDHQVELRRDELDRFEPELGDYLISTRGRFELWYAERERVRAGGPEDLEP
jgi:hypothetical protein